MTPRPPRISCGAMRRTQRGGLLEPARLPSSPNDPRCCEACGTTITPRTGGGGRVKRFCSAACRARAHRATPRPLRDRLPLPPGWEDLEATRGERPKMRPIAEVLEGMASTSWPPSATRKPAPMEARVSSRPRIERSR